LKRDTNLGTLNLRQYVNANRKAMQEELKKYEKQFLSRYKQPKASIKKSSNLKLGADIGTLSLRQYVNAKRKAKQDEIKKYEQKYLARYKEPKANPVKSSNLKSDTDIGKLALRQYVNAKRKAKHEEIKEYEQKYLTRYKQPKATIKKSTSWTQHDVALGRLTLSPHFNAKRRAKQDEIREYEQKYLSRYKEPKTKKNVGSDLYKPEIPKPKRDMKKERKEYEQKYLSRYKQPKSGVKKSTSWTQHDVALGRLTLSPHFNAKRRAKQDEIREYEKQYLSRYKEPKTKKRTCSDLYKPEIPKPKTDRRKERKEYEQKYLSRYKQPKLGVKKLSNLKHDIDAGALTLHQYINAKRKAKQDEIKKYEQKYLSRYKQPKIQKKKASSSLYKPEIPKPKRNMKKERKEYEQKYLSRYKQPKANLRKPLNLKSDDLGRLNLRKHTIAKRSEYLAKRKDYEEKYISRYMKKRKAEPKRSSSKNLDHDLISGRLDLRAFVDKKRHEIKTERTEYEKKYISKYKESKASIKKSKSLPESDNLGKFTISTKTTALKKLRAERAEYEKQYLTRYSKQQKAKPKKKAVSSDLYKPEIPKPKRDMKKERKEYEQKYLARHLKQRKTKPKKKKIIRSK